MSEISASELGFKVGDVVTIEGEWTYPNPNRCWWQFWKPKRIKTDLPAQYVVTGTASSTIYLDDERAQ